jgi:hypothetical protein
MALEPMYNAAIREEIAERLKTLLAQEQPKLSPQLDRLLRRFRELDHDASPSIVPDASFEAEPPKAATSQDWLQRLRDLARRS